MVKERWLTAAERATTRFPTPGEAKPSNGLSGQRGYIVQAVEDYLNRRGILDAKTLATGGYRITTTLDKAKQDAFVKAVTDNVMSKTSSDRAADRNVRVGGASIVPETGKVVALYGGIDYTKQYVSNATRRDYQVGSVFKPFVLTSAVVNDSTTQDGRRITPNTVYDGTNKRTVVGVQGSTDYAPANEDDVDYGDITVRIATDKSVNSVYAQMAQDVGPANGPGDRDRPRHPRRHSRPHRRPLHRARHRQRQRPGHGRGVRHPRRPRPARQIRPRREGHQGRRRDRTPGTHHRTGRQPRGRRHHHRRPAQRRGGRHRHRRPDGGPPAVGKTGTAEEDRAAWFAG
ncbi:Penicillin binding protein transpeptidase domain-containing protein, partial [Streptomyces sp. Ncost-T6T-2b]